MRLQLNEYQKLVVEKGSFSGHFLNIILRSINLETTSDFMSVNIIYHSVYRTHEC